MTSIFVAKLDFGVTEEELRSLFEAYGGVKKVHIATDRETGKPRGFAFVEMYNDDEAQQAISGLDGRNINGRDIAVKEAEDRKGGSPAPQKREFKPRTEFTPRPKPEANTEKSVDRDFVPPVKQDDDDFEETEAQKTEKRRKNNLPKTKEVDNTVDGSAKKKKLNPYKKSSKDQIYLDDEEDLDEFDLFGRDEDEDVDDDALSKYLVNSDEDEEYDDEDYDDEEYEDDDNW